MTAHLREQCFYMLGSMGSVIPFSLGLALGNPGMHVIGIEGDGSLLMNLGSLVTLKKYGTGNITIIILDNGMYESTGGQPTQPGGFDLYDICVATGLNTCSISSVEELNESWQNDVLIVKTLPGSVAERIHELPEVISKRFNQWLSLQVY